MSDTPGYLAYRIASGVIGSLPEPVIRRLGLAGGWLASFITRGRFALVQRNLARVVGEDNATPRRVRKMFGSYGRYWAEVLWIRSGRAEDIRRHSAVHGAEHITDGLAAGKGVIVALPHLGNWEMAGIAADDLGARMLAAAEALPNQKIVDWFIETRNAMNIDVVIVGRDRSSTAALLNRLKEGGAIALLSDRDLSQRGIEVEFFGERTTLPAGPAALAERTGAALLPVGCYFRRGRGHDFEVAPPIPIPDLPTKAARVAAMTQEFAYELERLIRKAPEQWHLFQPNWPSDREPR
ncbi:MAG TPA: phosphatidylinositol mannoside acyltransferase [Acidimicrobiia bacterium]|nr:phosphatidylinositol mannoside acyltransferase [Acidimicrobiia bacterium]